LGFLNPDSVVAIQRGGSSTRCAEIGSVRRETGGNDGNFDK
jgi:hypothetical protein